MRADIAINPATNDVVIANGDFALDTDSAITDARLLMYTNLGEWKADGTLGLGLQGRINGDETPGQLIKIEKDIRQQLGYDGLTVTKIDLTTNPYTVQING